MSRLTPHPNPQPNFFVSPKWLLADLMRFLAGSFVVLQRRKNVFCSGSPTDPLLAYQR